MKRPPRFLLRSIPSANCSPPEGGDCPGLSRSRPTEKFQITRWPPAVAAPPGSVARYRPRMRFAAQPAPPSTKKPKTPPIRCPTGSAANRQPRDLSKKQNPSLSLSAETRKSPVFKGPQRLIFLLIQTQRVPWCRLRICGRLVIGLFVLMPAQPFAQPLGRLSNPRAPRPQSNLPAPRKRNRIRIRPAVSAALRAAGAQPPAPETPPQKALQRTFRRACFYNSIVIELP